MQENLNILADKIYKEGIEKAEKDSTDIINQARKKAEEIIAEANKEAKQITDKAAKEADVNKKNVAADIQLAGVKAISVLKQKIRELLVIDLAEKPLGEAFSDPKFIKELVVMLAKQYQSAGAIEWILPEEFEKKADKAITNDLKKQLKDEKISYDSRVSNGFVIKQEDKNYYISFSDEDFTEFLRPFINRKTDELLFTKTAEN